MALVGTLLVNLKGKTAGFERSMKRASASTRRFQKKVGLVQKTLLKVGGYLAAAYGATRLVGVFQKSVKAAIEFEYQLAAVSTMLDKASMHFMPAYERGIVRLSMKFGQSVETLSKGLYDILSASVGAASAMEVLETAAMAAVGGMTKAGIAADGLTTTMNAYGIAARDVAKVADIQFAIVKRGKLTYEQLVGSIGKVANIAKMAGLTLPELGAAIAAVTRGGLGAEETMTAIRSAMGAVMAPSEEAQRIMQSFGMELSSTALKAKGLVGVLEQLATATPEELAKMFPKKGLVGIASMLGDLARLRKDVERFNKVMGGAGEATEKVGATTKHELATMGQVWAWAGRGIGKVAADIGKAIVFPFTATVQATHWLINADAVLRDRLDALCQTYNVLTEASKRAKEAVKAEDINEVVAAYREQIEAVKDVIHAQWRLLGTQAFDPEALKDLYRWRKELEGLLATEERLQDVRNKAAAARRTALRLEWARMDDLAKVHQELNSQIKELNRELAIAAGWMTETDWELFDLQSSLKLSAEEAARLEAKFGDIAALNKRIAEEEKRETRATEGQAVETQYLAAFQDLQDQMGVVTGRITDMDTAWRNFSDPLIDALFDIGMSFVGVGKKMAPLKKAFEEVWEAKKLEEMEDRIKGIKESLKTPLEQWKTYRENLKKVNELLEQQGKKFLTTEEMAEARRKEWERLGLAGEKGRVGEFRQISEHLDIRGLMGRERAPELEKMDRQIALLDRIEQKITPGGLV